MLFWMTYGRAAASLVLAFALLAATTCARAQATSGEAPPPAADAASAPSTALPKVEIRARRTPAVAGSSSMTGDELRSVPGTTGDPMKALQSLPGVAVTDDSSSAPAIRGSRPSDNAYYIDFLPVGYLFHVGGLVSVVHSDLVTRFDLYSAAFGPEYDDVTGAVLDVSLRAPRTDRWGGTLNVSLLGADVLVEGPVADKQSFYFAAKRSYLDLLLKTVRDDASGVVVTVPHYSDYQAKYLWDVNGSNRLTFHATGAADHLEFQVPANSTAAAQDPVLTGDSAFATSYGTQAVVWEADLGKRASNKLAIGQTLDKDDSSLGMQVRAVTRSHKRFMREQLSLKPNDTHSVLLGGSYESTRVSYDLDLRNARCTEFDPNCDLTSADQVNINGEVQAHIANTFVRDRWQFATDWAATVGVHHTHDSYLKRSYTEPRLNLEWSWAPGSAVSLGWGRHNQFPAGDQVLEGLGNTGLWHIRATHRMLAVSQQLADGWSWRAEAYRKTFTDFVVADPALNYINGASGHASGLELLVKKDSSAKWSGWLSVSLSRARRHNDVTGEDFAFAFDQPVIVSLVGQYKASERWQFGARWGFHSGSPDTPVVGTGTYPDGRVRPLYGDLNSERLPSYHRLDLRADRIVSPTFRYYAEMINAYNHKNVSGYSYSADYSTRTPQTQLPMLLSFGLVQQF